MATITMPESLPLPSPRGHKFSTCVSPVLPSSPPRGHKFLTCEIRRARRSAFTLVELLVVIGIIAILAALVTPAVMRAQASARNAAIKAEIDMLHMAIMNYKNEYGGFPPCVSGTGPNSLAGKHVQRIFPRSTPNPDSRSPDNAIVRWLKGYSSDPTDPFGSVSGSTRDKLFDFDASRLTTSDQYYPAGKSASPYLYFNSGTSSVAYGTLASPNQLVLTSSGTYSPQIQALATGTNFFNPDTFQILCAGRDEQFGTEDDLSNFWPGTRQDYLDSLKQ